MTGSPKEVGAVFRQRLLDIPNLKNEQRLGVLKTIDTSTISDLGPIKEVIARDHYFNIFSSGIKNSEEEQKCIYEITRLSKIYSQTSIKELLDFLSAFDPIYEKGFDRFVSSEVTIIEDSQKELAIENINIEPKIKWIKNEYKSLERDFKDGLKTFNEEWNEIKPNINFDTKGYLKEWGIQGNKIVKKVDLPGKLGGLFEFIGSLIGLVSVLLMKDIVRINLYQLKGISYASASNIARREIAGQAWVISAIIMISIVYFLFYFLEIKKKGIPIASPLKPYQERRMKCKPLHMAFFSWFLSPAVFGLIYAIRQRSWCLIFWPTWIMFFSYFFIVIPYPIPLWIKTIVKAFMALATYLIARKQKIETRLAVLTSQSS